MPTAPPPIITSPRVLGLGLLLVLAAGHFGAVVTRGFPGVAAADLQSQFGLNDTAFGLLHGPAYVGVHVVGMVVAAAVIDRLDRFRTMAVCILVWTLGSLIFAMAESVEVLVAGRLLIGLGQAAFAPCAASLIIDRSGNAFAKPLSFLTGGSALGRSAGIMLAGLLLGVLAGSGLSAQTGLADWRVAGIALSVPFLALAVVLVRFRDPRESRSPDDGQGLGGTLAWCWSRRTALAPHLLAASSVILLGHATTAWMPSVFQRVFDLGAAPAALMAGSTILIGAPIGHFVGGFALDRWMAAGHPPIQTIMASQGLCAACGLMLGLSTTPWMAWIAATGVALALGVGSLAALVAFQPVTPSHRRASVTALFFASVTLVGMGLGPPLVGLVSDEAFEAGAGLGSAIAVVIVAVALIGSLVALLATPIWRRLEREAVAVG